MRYSLIVLAVLGLLVAGCSKPAPPPEPEAQAPKDKTEAEYGRQLREGLPNIQDLRNLPEEAILAGLGEAKEKLRSSASGESTENKTKAINKFSEELLGNARQFRDEEKWAAVKAACELRAVLNSDTSQTERLLARAEQVLARPKIAVKGFMEVGDQVFILLECRSLQTGETNSFRILEGEEFGNKLRLSRIIGNREAIEILDINTSDTWEVPGPTGQPQVAAPAMQMMPQQGAAEQPPARRSGRHGSHGGDDE